MYFLKIPQESKYFSFMLLMLGRLLATVWWYHLI